ncbi:hypothetical protein F9C11_14330 [Amycolatopsis sp. VS8301801F10]|uniref:hypothetical protein n=1 Tax=unclassified Amycolatopsis TaxID=2618356 RepID=UPI0038FCB9EE
MTSVPGVSAEDSGPSDDRHLVGEVSRAADGVALDAANASHAADGEPVDGETRDVVRLLRRLGGRAFALAFVAGITGLTTVALVLGLAGFALVLAPVRGVRRGGGPAAPAPRGW